MFRLFLTVQDITGPDCLEVGTVVAMLEDRGQTVTLEVWEGQQGNIFVVNTKYGPYAVEVPELTGIGVVTLLGDFII